METTWIGGEGIPGTAGVNDRLVGLEDAPSEEILAKALPDIFLGIQFGAVGWQTPQGEVIRPP